MSPERAAGVREALRCSTWARSHDVDPIGSAGCHEGFLLVELPLPWPADVADHPALREVSQLARRANIRLQAIVPQAEVLRLIAFRKPDQGRGFAGFVRDDLLAGRDVAADAANLMSTVPGSVQNSSGTTGERVLLLCTHGRRDACCGSLGTGLFQRLGLLSLPQDVGRWRTSHTGGHRFSPTFIVLPEGTAWAFGDEDLIQRVLNRTGDPAALLDRYRGCVGLTSARVQALEREVIRNLGWDVLDRRRRGWERGDGRVELHLGGTDKTDMWEAVVTPGRVVPVPECGRPIEEAKKTDLEWAVSNLRRL